MDESRIHPGVPYPFGVSFQGDLTNFALISAQAEQVTLCLFDNESGQLIEELTLSPSSNKTGNVWHIAIEHLDRQWFYAYKTVPTINPRQHLLLDPYAKGVSTGIAWGENTPYIPLGCIVEDSSFDWDNDTAPNIPANSLIIYEMHVRAFTNDPSSQVKNRGTFLGIIEKIPHLLELGINAIELLPIQEFNEMEYRQSHPNVQLNLYNFWGYSTVNFFAPMNRYASSTQRGAAIHEFKTMVKALHQHGIEVILDVVFNHTAEGNLVGPVLSYKGIDNATFYMLDGNDAYVNASGCGNTFNANNPVALQLIITTLRYWVTEMHVDGFRFDLASALTRNNHGTPLKPPPLIAAITQDPILASTKLIAEPWDAAGLYQVGHFAPETKRWSEWNDKYRDTVRRFIKGTPGCRGEFAARISGSQDLYHNRAPYNSINFITCHDGFTLNDLVSYNNKHNLNNGEQNRDGTNHNESWNCGVEGPSSGRGVELLRERQMRNFHVALMTSQGIPMLHMGDEYGHTKNGNNNTWCHDDPLNWFLWDHLAKNGTFARFYRTLIKFRKEHPILQRTTFLSDKDVDWHGLKPLQPNWSDGMLFVAFTLKDHDQGNDLYVAFNAQERSVKVELPVLTGTKKWHWVVNTSNTSPSDIFENGQEPICQDAHVEMMGHSTLVLKYG